MTTIPSEQIKTREILDWKGLHLLNFRTSSCSQKLRIYLNLKKISWTSHSINLAAGKNYTEWFLGINPKGLIPVLVDDGHVEIESNDILMYLEKKFPQNPLVDDSEIESMKSLLKDEDDLHEDIRNIAYRYMFGGLGKKSSKGLEVFKNYKSFNSELDTLKMKEVEFYETYGEEGITNEAVKQSLTKFCKRYDKFEGHLNNQKYLMGDKLSMLDLAWFIYSYRLYISGFPFRELYPYVSNWFEDLYARNEFYKEVNDPLILKLIRQYAKISTAISGKSIKALMPK
jgi:glutathione S-transferase